MSTELSVAASACGGAAAVCQLIPGPGTVIGGVIGLAGAGLGIANMVDNANAQKAAEQAQLDAQNDTKYLQNLSNTYVVINQTSGNNERRFSSQRGDGQPTAPISPVRVGIIHRPATGGSGTTGTVSPGRL